MELLRSFMLTISSVPPLMDISFFEAARFTDQFFRAVGQEASPSKCVLLSTSKATRRSMKIWSISAGNKGWGVKLDVRELGVGHLDITNRACAGTLAQRAIRATSQVPMVGALPFGFLKLVGIVRSKFLPAGLHGAEGSHISCKNLSLLAEKASYG